MHIINDRVSSCLWQVITLFAPTSDFDPWGLAVSRGHTGGGATSGGRSGGGAASGGHAGGGAASRD